MNYEDVGYAVADHAEKHGQLPQHTAVMPIEVLYQAQRVLAKRACVAYMAAKQAWEDGLIVYQLEEEMAAGALLNSADDIDDVLHRLEN